MTNGVGVQRLDQQWVDDLSSEGDRRDQALADLRDLMFRGLRRAVGSNRGLSDSALEDIVQDSLLKTLRKIDTFRGQSRFTTWAMSIAVHGAMSELRRRRWKDISLDRAAEDSEFQPELAVDAGLSPEREAEQRAILDAMRSIIESELTAKQRQALLATFGGMPMEQIAEKLGSNRNAVYKLTFDARKKLRDGLHRAGYAADDVRTVFSF